MIRSKAVLPAIHFHFLKAAGLAERTRLRAFLSRMVKSEAGLTADLSFIFCSDDHLLEMNRKFLHHDYYTDILTFPLDSGAGKLSGEMYISIDRVRDNAKSLHVSVANELHRVIFHGTLHLCGYSDKKPDKQKLMRAREDHYLRRYFK